MLLAHIKYQNTHMLCSTLYTAITILLEMLFCIFLKKKCVRYHCLPVVIVVIAIRLKGSRHQEVYEYYTTTPHTLFPLSI